MVQTITAPTIIGIISLCGRPIIQNQRTLVKKEQKTINGVNNKIIISIKHF
jgi:hypothetical protein